MQIPSNKTINLICKYTTLIVGISLFSGCAPSNDFQTTPQQGAWRSGIYPDFSVKPKAETTQITDEEKKKLSEKLASDSQNINHHAYTEKKQNNSLSPREEANREINDVLQDITDPQ